MITPEARYSVVRSFFEAAMELSLRVALPRVQQVQSFLGMASYLAYPKADGTFHRWEPLVPDEFTGQKEVRVYLFHDEDLPHLSSDCIRALNLRNRGAVAGYENSTRMLKLRAELRTLSPFTKGLLLLHEGCHAWLQQTQGATPRTRSHEYAVRYFDLEWLTTYGGVPYLELLNKWKDKLRPQLPKRLRSPEKSRPLYYPDELQSIWGPAASSFERELRTSQFYGHVLIALVQEQALPLEEQAEQLRHYL